MINMAQKIKVYRIGDSGLEFEEMNFEEAERVLEEARARGNVVINKKDGEAVEKISPDIDEILVVALIAGG